MTSSLIAALACAVLCTLSHSALAVDAPDGKLVGHYYLEGVTEVGSELLLKKDGTFEWALSYGAVDQLANGKWTMSGKQVKLLASGPEGEPVFTLFSEEDTRRLVSPDEDPPGQWKAEIGIPGAGGMPDVEIRFEAKSGKSAIAVTGRRGEAIVKMPAAEIWVRAGLRRKQSQAHYQWFTIPAARAQARAAAFTPGDPKWLGNQGFNTLDFTIVEGGLKASADSALSRGVYVRRPAN